VLLDTDGSDFFFIFREYFSISEIVNKTSVMISSARRFDKCLISDEGIFPIA
jgi:hypothetical protein